MSPSNNRHVVFKKNATVGAVDAIEDAKYLENCFVDTGELDILRDVSNPKCLILGRVGSGKTALIQVLKKNEERIVVVSPNDLSINYLSNDPYLKEMFEAGYNVALFFEYLWKHIFILQIIRIYFNLSPDLKINNFLEQIKSLNFKNRSSNYAKEYLLSYSDKFWEISDEKVMELSREIVKSKNGKISTGSDVKGVNAKLSLEGGTSVKDSSKSELTKTGKYYIDPEQMGKITKVVQILGEELLTDKVKKIYICIDRLDDNWTFDYYKYKLIRALIETAKDINAALPNVKIIISLREDLLRKVFDDSFDAQDQIEKFESLFLKLRWKKENLREVVNRRINFLMKDQYTNSDIELEDVFPHQIGQENSIDYLINRTLKTPRDLVILLNLCLEKSEGETNISSESIKEAEYTFSENRLKYLVTEWIGIYSNLDKLLNLFYKQKNEFLLEEFDIDQLQSNILNYMIENEDKRDDFYIWCDSFDLKTIPKILRDLFEKAYTVGLLGYSEGSSKTISWSFEGKSRYTKERISQYKFIIHPAFWETLAIRA